MKNSAKLCLILLFVSSSVAMAGYRFQVIDVPGATATTAFGIGVEGVVVGSYVDKNGRTHGFRRNGDSIDTIDYAGAVLTAARAISPTGVIVGTYRKPGEPAVNVHGYSLTTDGVFHAADYPGHINTIPQRILADGTIYGCYHDTDTMMTMHGMALWDGGNAEVETPASMANGGLPDRSVSIGFYTDMMTNVTHSYVMVNGAFEPFDYPEAKMTQAWDINASGSIVGVFIDGSNKVRSFVLTDGEFVAFDMPGAVETRAFGIDQYGNIVGSFLDASRKTHAFLALHTFVAPGNPGPRLERQ